MLLFTALIGVVACASVPVDNNSQPPPLASTSHPAPQDAIVKQLVDIPKTSSLTPGEPMGQVPGNVPGNHAGPFVNDDVPMNMDNSGFDGRVLGVIRRYTHALSKRLYPDQVPMALHMAPNKRREQLPPEDEANAGYSPEAVGMLRELVKRVERYLQETRHQGPQSPPAAHRPRLPEEHPLPIETDKDVGDLLRLVSAQQAMKTGPVEDNKGVGYINMETDTSSGQDAQSNPHQLKSTETTEAKATSS